MTFLYPYISTLFWYQYCQHNKDHFRNLQIGGTSEATQFPPFSFFLLSTYPGNLTIFIRMTSTISIVAGIKCHILKPCAPPKKFFCCCLKFSSQWKQNCTIFNFSNLLISKHKDIFHQIRILFKDIFLCCQALLYNKSWVVFRFKMHLWIWI